MTLKKSTNLTIGCIVFSIMWEITYWTINSFELIEFSKAPWFYKLWIIPFLIFYIGLLLFFITLSKKQQGGGNG